MASISGATSSLGNTALRGFGGLMSGIDRDSLIEQMTLGTTNKINNQKQAMTKLQWKQEAYQGLSGKIIDLEDKYLSYSSTNSLKNPGFFAKNQISVNGDSSVTKYVKASGTSNMTDHLSLLGVKQLATAAGRLSDSKTGPGTISTEVTQSRFESDVKDVITSKLEGTNLVFGTYNAATKQFTAAETFTFPASYTVTNADGKTETKEIDYTAAPEEVVAQLNEALNSKSFMGKDGKAGIQFTLSRGNLGIVQTDAITDEAKNYQIRDTSSALSALGFDSSKLTEENREDGISFDEFGASTTSFSDAYVTRQTIKDYLTGKSITVSYEGESKSIELMTKEEAATVTSFDDFKALLQKKINRAFGSDKVSVKSDAQGALTFGTTNAQATLTVSADSAETRKVLGIESNQSTKMSLDASLYYNREQLGFSKDMTEDEFSSVLQTLTINGEKLSGVTKDTTVNQLISMINENKDMGVRAAYVAETNQFSLTALSTGSGRTIELGGAAQTIFGSQDAANNRDGQDAQFVVDYGNGIQTTLTRSTNTVDLGGLSVTVSSTFGFKKDADGNATTELDPTQAVTFSGAADVEGVTKQVKQFIEDYNALVTEINNQVTTKPNSTYAPLTDAQKEEMSEESIKNWEEQGKKGQLFGDSVVRDLSSDVQTVFARLMQGGVSPTDLEKIGITASSNYKDGGTISFDEEKFKAAMQSDPELVSDIVTGGENGKTGLIGTIEDTLNNYATRFSYKNNGSYGRLVERAGSDKLPLSSTKNEIYSQLEEMQKKIDSLNEQLQTEQDRYINQFSTLETLISKMNSQSSYLSSLMG